MILAGDEKSSHLLWVLPAEVVPFPLPLSFSGFGDFFFTWHLYQSPLPFQSSKFHQFLSRKTPATLFVWKTCIYSIF